MQDAAQLGCVPLNPMCAMGAQLVVCHNMNGKNCLAHLLKRDAAQPGCVPLLNPVCKIMPQPDQCPDKTPKFVKEQLGCVPPNPVCGMRLNSRMPTVLWLSREHKSLDKEDEAVYAVVLDTP